MGRIEFTNIIIDDFTEAKKNPHNKYIHILTHIHSDHLKGLNNSWQYGPIYCTKITKQLLGNKFPALKCLNQLTLDQQHILNLSKSLQVTVTLMNANHCPGAAIVLIQGYMGRVLYTGDMRFNKQIFQQYYYLYPGQYRNTDFKKCSKQIDVLYLDNTFLNARFTFPTQKQALIVLDNFMDELKQSQTEKYIYIGMDNYGKEQILIHLSLKYNTYIVVDQIRYENLKAMEVDIECFTTNCQQGFIKVVKKSTLYKILRQDDNAIGIIFTGWANKFYKKYNNHYFIPYSLHSNFKELCQFTQSICPSYIYPIVSSSKQQRISNDSNDSMYKSVNYEQALTLLRKKYTSPVQPQYWQLLSNAQLQNKINQKLQLNRSIEEVNRVQYGLATVHIHNPLRKGYKLNNERNQEQIKQIKDKLQRRRMISEQVTNKVVKTSKFINNYEIINDDEQKQIAVQQNNKSKFTSITQIQLNQIPYYQILKSRTDIKHFLLNNQVFSSNHKNNQSIEKE